MTEPRTEAGRTTAGKVCWALHALTLDHNPDCTVIREGILAIEREATGRRGAMRIAARLSREEPSDES